MTPTFIFITIHRQVKWVEISIIKSPEILFDNVLCEFALWQRTLLDNVFCAITLFCLTMCFVL